MHFVPQISLAGQKVKNAKILHPYKVFAWHLWITDALLYFALLISPDTDPLWVQLLGAYSTGAGEIISPDTAAPARMPIFAAADGTVETANGSDLWGRVWILHQNLT